MGRKGLENAVYISNSWTASDKINIDYGLRFSFYSVLGGATYNIYQANHVTKSIPLAKGKVGKTYYTWEPRFWMNYKLCDAANF